MNLRSIIRKLYQLLPYKRFLFQFVRSFWIPPNSILKHLHFKGVIKIPVETTTSKFKMMHYGYRIENELFWKGIYGGWEKNSLFLWSQLCVNAEVILDIGSNTGVYSMLSKTVSPNAKIYSFEPVERVYEKLVKNIELNDFDIKSEKVAISNHTGKATIYDSDTEHTLSVSVNKNISLTPENTFPVEIETITLDDYIRKENMHKIDLIKIEVEQHEYEVLEGFLEYLPKFQPNFLIEILNNDIASKLESIFSRYDYRYFNIDELTSVKEVDHLTKSDYFNFLIIKPKDSEKLKMN